MKLDDRTKLDAVIARRARLEQLACGRHKNCTSLQTPCSDASNWKLVDKASRLNAIKSDILHECCDHLRPPSLHDLVNMYTVDVPPSNSSCLTRPQEVTPTAAAPTVLRALVRQPADDLLAQWRQQRAQSTLHSRLVSTAQPDQAPTTSRLAVRHTNVGVQVSTSTDGKAMQTVAPTCVEVQTSTVATCAVGTSAPNAAEAAPPWRQWLSDAAISACAATFAAHVLLHMAGMRSVGRPAADAAVQVECTAVPGVGAVLPPSNRQHVDTSMDDDVSVLVQQAVEGVLFPEERESGQASHHHTQTMLQRLDVVNYIWEQLAHVVQEPGMEQVLASCVQSAYAQVAQVVPLRGIN